MVSCEYGRDHGLWSATHSHYLIYLKLTSKKALFVVALLVTLHFLAQSLRLSCGRRFRHDLIAVLSDVAAVLCQRVE